MLQKRMTLVLAISALTTLSLVGCYSKPESKQAKQEAPAATEQPAAPAEGAAMAESASPGEGVGSATSTKPAGTDPTGGAQ